MPRRLAATILIALSPLPAQAAVEREVFAMGTRLVVEAEAGAREQALAASEAALRAVEAVEARLSVWREDTDVSRINAARPGVRVPVGLETAADLRWAFALAEVVDGAFDPTAGPLVAAYGLRAEPRWPDDATRRAAVAEVGCALFDVGEAAVTRLRAGAALDCDAFGKGVALDRALAAATAAGATRVWFDFGGQVMSGGSGAAATEVAIADPDDRSRVLRSVRLPPGWSAATSGNGERRAAAGDGAGGRPLGHLLDPRTGLPARDFGSVTVLASSAALADAAATALFVLGPEHGPAAAGRLGVRATFAVRDSAR